MRYIVISAIGVVAIAFATRVFALQSPVQSAVRMRSDTVRLTLAQAERMALEQNAVFLAAQAGIDVARGELRQARALAPNPQAEFEALNSGGELGGYRSSLTQELEIGGQRSARAGAAAAALARTEYLGADAARGLVRDVRAAFFRSLAARRRLGVMEDMLVLQDRLLDAVRIQLAEGEISALDANLAEVEVGRSRARLLAAQRLQAEAEHELKTQLGFPPQQMLALVAPDSLVLPDAAGIDSLVSLALSRRPDLAAMNAAVEQASRMASLANRSSIPNPTVGVLAERENATGQAQLGFVIGLPVPLWNRNRGATAARRADVARAEFEFIAAETRIRNEVAAATKTYALAVDELEILESAVLTPARDNQRLLEIAYREGKSDLPTILLLRNQLLEAELDYLDAWLAAGTALANLEAAVGAPLQTDNGSDDR